MHYRINNKECSIEQEALQVKRTVSYSYQLVAKLNDADNLNVEKNSSYLAANAKDASVNHQYAVILDSDDVKAKKILKN